MKFYFYFHKQVCYFFYKLHYNRRTNIYVIFKVQFDFALEEWFSIVYMCRHRYSSITRKCHNHRP